MGVQLQKSHQDTQNPPKPYVLDILDLPDIPDGDQKYSQCPKDSKNVSYVRLQLQNPYQDTQNPPKPHVLDIIDLPDLPDGDQKSCTSFQSTPNIPRIPKMYHIWGFYAKISIKTAKILRNPMF